MTTSKRKSQSVTASITTLQYEESLAKFAANDVKLVKKAAELEEEINSIREEYSTEIDILAKEQEMLMAVIKGYCVQNRSSLLPENKKSFETLFGTIGFRKSNPALKTLTGFTWATVLEKLQEVLPDHVRKYEEPDKEKLLADRDKEEVSKHFATIGVKVHQDEKFFIELKKETVPTATV